MDSLQFALAVIIIAVLFLAFSLAIIAVLLGNRTSQASIVKLFKILLNRLSSFFK